MAFVPVYILILFFTIVVDYIAGILIEPAEGSRRRLFLVMSIVTNVGILAFFKYYNFFVENVNYLFSTNGHSQVNIPILSILLPMGLSFHTFQAMSYTIEVYRGNQKPERHFGIYALYVMFYPQLVAGPIERPQNLLHQFHERHDFDYENCKEGLKQMLWGFFKKIVIADRLSLIVKPVYAHPSHFNGMSLTLATIFFAFQLYCDFSGYSDIALGSARVMGIKLMVNFNRPYSSKNVTEYWRRWHISLSTWFYDYLFNPTVAALRNWGKQAIMFGLILTFFLSGFWHGAAWHYVVWGIIWSIAMVFEFYTKKIRKKYFKMLPDWLNTSLSVLFTFSYACFAGIFFRAANLHDAFYICARLAHGWNELVSFSAIKASITAMGENDTVMGVYNIVTGILLIIFLEYVQMKTNDKPALDIVKDATLIKKWSFYYFLIISMLVIGVYNNQEFIYFQF